MQKQSKRAELILPCMGSCTSARAGLQKAARKCRMSSSKARFQCFTVLFFYSLQSPTFSSTLFEETTFLKVCSSHRHYCQNLTVSPPIFPHFLLYHALFVTFFGDDGLYFAEMYPAYPESHNGRRNFPSTASGPGSGVLPLPKSYARSDRSCEDDQPWVPRGGHGGGSASVSARGQHRGGYEPHTGYHHASSSPQYPSQQYQPPYPQVVCHIYASILTRSSF